jgi:hypothetical protein
MAGRPKRARARPGEPTCGAILRDGTRCDRRAGFATDHPGTGRCARCATSSAAEDDPLPAVIAELVEARRAGRRFETAWSDALLRVIDPDRQRTDWDELRRRARRAWAPD